MSLIPSFQGPPGPQGPPGATGGYNQWLNSYTALSQTGTPNAVNYVELQTSVGNGINVNLDGNGKETEVTFSTDGVYSITFSAQVVSSSSNEAAEFWLRRNGTTDIPWSNTRIQLKGGSAEEVITINYVESFSPGDYFQLVWVPTDAGVQLYAESPVGIHPGIPSVILTAYQVGTF